MRRRGGHHLPHHLLCGRRVGRREPPEPLAVLDGLDAARAGGGDVPDDGRLEQPEAEPVGQRVRVGRRGRRDAPGQPVLARLAQRVHPVQVRRGEQVLRHVHAGGVPLAVPGQLRQGIVVGEAQHGGERVGLHVIDGDGGGGIVGVLCLPHGARRRPVELRQQHGRTRGEHAAVRAEPLPADDERDVGARAVLQHAAEAAPQLVVERPRAPPQHLVGVGGEEHGALDHEAVAAEQHPRRGEVVLQDELREAEAAAAYGGWTRAEHMVPAARVRAVVLAAAGHPAAAVDEGEVDEHADLLPVVAGDEAEEDGGVGAATVVAAGEEEDVPEVAAEAEETGDDGLAGAEAGEGGSLTHPIPIRFLSHRRHFTTSRRHSPPSPLPPPSISLAASVACPGVSSPSSAVAFSAPSPHSPFLAAFSTASAPLSTSASPDIGGFPPSKPFLVALAAFASARVSAPACEPPPSLSSSPALLSSESRDVAAPPPASAGAR
ncbi:hypothetical protein DAI22_08g120400 [Oryza sativa Japonica Group]|nr:hypothetical protein DAI22_08g120400 [Oryza sativa Japonica Group]